MTTSSVNNVAAATTITGNQITITGNALTAPYSAGNTSGIPLSAVAYSCLVVGTIQGYLRLPFADPDTLEGAISVADLKSAQVCLTQGNAGATGALVVEELYLG